MLRTIGPLPVRHVVDPKGRIRRLKIAQNISHPCLQIEEVVGPNGPRIVVEIRGTYVRDGWEFLERIYGADPNPQLRAEGYRRYVEWENAGLGGRLSQAPKPESPALPLGAQNMHTQGFPEEWLPEEVRKRRAGTSDVSAGAYEPPEAPNGRSDALESSSSPNRKGQGRAKAS